MLLLILRHAKAEANRPGRRDFDRELSSRGRRAASEMGRAMRERGFEPRLALCSPARRTTETLELVAAEFESETPVVSLAAIYDADPQVLMSVIAEHGESASPLLLVGHNPGVQQLALAVARPQSSADLDAIGAKFPTGALAVFDVAIGNWHDLSGNIARLQAYLRPRELV